MEAQHAYNNSQRRDEKDAQIIFCTSNVYILLSAHSTDQKKHSSCLLIHTELPAECLLLCACVCVAGSLSVFLSACPSICVSVWLTVCTSICLPYPFPLAVETWPAFAHHLLQMKPLPTCCWKTALAELVHTYMYVNVFTYCYMHQVTEYHTYRFTYAMIATYL